MDPIAHTLLGATLAETGLRRTTPLAAAILIIGANLPDVDAIATVFGRDVSLYHRRGWTHGVLAMAVLPLVLVGVLWAYDRYVRRRRKPEQPAMRLGPAIGLAYVAVLSHSLFDFMNTYGVRLLMPFDGSWFYGDALFIIDPWMWLLVGASVVLAGAKSKPGIVTWIALATATTTLITVSGFAPWPAKVVWVIGLMVIVWCRFRGIAPATVRRTAVVCLATLGVYILAMLTASSAAKTQAETWLRDRGYDVGMAMASPRPANPFAWDVVATLPDGYRFLRVSWLGQPRIEEFAEPAPRDERSAIVQAALNAPSVRGMRNWMRFPSYVVEALDDGGYRVTINDVRYTRTIADDAHPDRRPSIGHAIVELDGDLQPR